MVRRRRAMRRRRRGIERGGGGCISMSFFFERIRKRVVAEGVRVYECGWIIFLTERGERWEK